MKSKTGKHQRLTKIIFHSRDFIESFEYPLVDGKHTTDMGRAKRRNYKNQQKSNSTDEKHIIDYTNTSDSQNDSQSDSQISSPETNHQSISFFEEAASINLQHPNFYIENSYDLPTQSQNVENILENDFSQIDFQNSLHIGLATFLSDIHNLTDVPNLYIQPENSLIDEQYFDNQIM